MDRNNYYGGDEAALSLKEAEDWAQRHCVGSGQHGFIDAECQKSSQPEEDPKSLGPSRAYSLALAPQLVYARSNVLPALVSSRTHEQLEFQAVGSWFTISSSDGTPSIVRVPSGREDIFSDNSLDLRAKRSLMKFIRFVTSYDTEEQQQQWHNIRGKFVTQSLREDFGLQADAAVAPLLALALTPSSADTTKMESVVPRIARHLRSTGMFGPGFSAVLPKYGGMAEVAQVACRACAVGGGTYVLGKGVESMTRPSEERLAVCLSGDEMVTAKWLAGCPDDLPSPPKAQEVGATPRDCISRCIAIVSSPLSALFPPTSEGGVIPAGAVIIVDSGEKLTPPVQIIAHSSDSGECPQGQCKSSLSIQSPPVADAGLPDMSASAMMIQPKRILIYIV